MISQTKADRYANEPKDTQIKIYRDNGKLLYEGGVKDGEPHGFGKFYYENGNLLYKGEQRDGHQHG